MGIYIKGMKMPENCSMCIFMHTTYMLSRHVCLARNMAEIKVKTSSGIDANCPLIEVPEPHGALIDRDALKNNKFTDTNHDYRLGWNEAIEAIMENADVIIEGSEDE